MLLERIFSISRNTSNNQLRRNKVSQKIYPPTKDRRDIGEVIPFIEKMDAFRETSSCCVGVEANIESNKNLKGFLNQNSSLPKRS